MDDYNYNGSKPEISSSWNPSEQPFVCGVPWMHRVPQPLKQWTNKQNQTSWKHSELMQWLCYSPQMLHVWNIYQHLPHKWPSFVGIYIPAPWFAYGIGISCTSPHQAALSCHIKRLLGVHAINGHLVPLQPGHATDARDAQWHRGTWPGACCPQRNPPKIHKDWEQIAIVPFSSWVYDHPIFPGTYGDVGYVCLGFFFTFCLLGLRSVWTNIHLIQPKKPNISNGNRYIPLLISKLWISAIPD